jgi:4'-phosphopantetheinyl transferase EntD
VDTDTLSALHEALAALAPPGVACSVEAVTSDHGVFTEEEALIARAVRSRRCEFAAGRRCARAALRDLGCAAIAIGRGHLGQPLWPRAFAGSIAHERRVAAAIAYRSSDTRHAIDLVEELDLGTLPEIAASLLGEDERLLCADDPGLLAEVFSAKEAVIKILSPRLQRYVDFRELVVAPGDDGWSVEAPDGSRLVTRRRIVDGVLLTVASAAT